MLTTFVPAWNTKEKSFIVNLLNPSSTAGSENFFLLQRNPVVNQIYSPDVPCIYIHFLIRSVSYIQLPFCNELHVFMIEVTAVWQSRLAMWLKIASKYLLVLHLSAFKANKYDRILSTLIFSLIYMYLHSITNNHKMFPYTLFRKLLWCWLPTFETIDVVQTMIIGKTNSA